MRSRLDTAWGVDRYKSSVNYGSLEVPVIYLWRAPNCVPSKDNLTGAVKHGTEITVKRRKVRDDIPWYFVETDIEHKGEIYHQEGWVSGKLLKDLGRELFEI